MMTWLFALLGLVLGVTQARLLLRSVRGKAQPLHAILRLALVAVALVFAARAGHLLACAGAWFIAFAASALVLQRRLR